MDNLPHRWMAQQQQSGHQLCLMLEGNHEARQPLLADRAPSHYCSLYSETDAAELANSGPLILLLEQMNEPAPGDYPAPEPPPWLDTPNPQADAILHANILRYLLAEHSEDLAALVEFQDPRIWLAQVLKQARTWQWRKPEQLEFLVVRRLAEATGSSVVHWQPRAGEAPEEHFERVAAQWRREVGSGE